MPRPFRPPSTDANLEDELRAVGQRVLNVVMRGIGMTGVVIAVQFVIDGVRPILKEILQRPAL